MRIRDNSDRENRHSYIFYSVRCSLATRRGTGKVRNLPLRQHLHRPALRRRKTGKGRRCAQRSRSPRLGSRHAKGRGPRRSARAHSPVPGKRSLRARSPLRPRSPAGRRRRAKARVFRATRAGARPKTRLGTAQVEHALQRGNRRETEPRRRTARRRQEKAKAVVRLRRRLKALAAAAPQPRLLPWPRQAARTSATASRGFPRAPD